MGNFNRSIHIIKFFNFYLILLDFIRPLQLLYEVNLFQIR